MTSPKHFQANSPIPVYAVAIPRSDVVLYAGGGGRSRSGVSNAIRAASIELNGQRLLERTEVKLSNEEDAPMCLAVSYGDESEEPLIQNAADTAGLKNVNIGPSHRQIVTGINSPLTQSGSNSNLRQYDWKSSGYKPVSEVSMIQRATDAVREQVKSDEPGENTRIVDVQSIEMGSKAESVAVKDLEQYIRVTVISPNNRYLAVGATDGQIALHAFPSLEKIWLANPLPSTEVIDATFSSDSSLVAFVLPNTILIYSTSSASSSKPEVYQTIRNPALKGTTGCVFRAAKFGRSSGKGIGRSDRLYTVVNSNPPSGLGSSKRDREKARTRLCFVSMWDADKWTVIKTTRISDRPATVLALSDNGKHLAVSTSDLVIHLLSSSTLSTIWRLKEVHAFPSTCLAFSPNGNTLISGSADMSLRVMEIGAAEEPATLQHILESKTSTLLLALVLALLAYYVQQRIAPSLPKVMDIQ